MIMFCLLLLDKDKKFVISIIILHSGKIPMQTLKALLRQSDMLMLEDEIDALIADTEYIKIEDESYILKHATLGDSTPIEISSSSFIRPTNACGSNSAYRSNISEMHLFREIEKKFLFFKMLE